jgi:hypothetical protein
VLASYHLEIQPTTFDVASWLVTVKTWGATEASILGKKFKHKNGYPDEVARSRLEHIVRPLFALAELPIVEKPEPGPYFTHFMKGVHMAWRENSKIWKYPYKKKHDHVSVTLRNSFRNKSRDSNRPEWEKVISWLENNGEKVVVLEDREKDPISIQDRWDAYQCKFNLFTGGGPSYLCFFSDAPYISFFKGLTEHDYYLLMIHHWHYTNMKFPWAKKNQRVVWGEDKFENIVRNFERVATSGGH